MGPHVDLLQSKEVVTEEEERKPEQQDGRNKSVAEGEGRGEEEKRSEMPTERYDAERQHVLMERSSEYR